MTSTLVRILIGSIAFLVSWYSLVTPGVPHMLLWGAMLTGLLAVGNLILRFITGNWED